MRKGKVAGIKSAFDKQIGGSHYKDLEVQPAVFLRPLNVEHLEGEIIYRVLRHKKKNGEEDIRKAIHGLELILELDYGTK